MIDINDIKNIIPHRYPFLLVDRVLEFSDNSVIAIKNVTINENFFQGHFPKNPIMPGVLIVEALAQAGAIILLKKPELEGKTPYFTGIDKLKFRQKVIPGDTLILKAELVSFKFGIGKAKVEAIVLDKTVCSGEISFYFG